MSNRGKNFEREFKNSLESFGMYAMRIADKVYWNGIRMASEQTPADFLAYLSCDRLVALMIECKATAQKSLPFDNLQQHQRDALETFDAFDDDAKGYIAVNFYDGSNIRNRNECYLIPISIWCEYADKGDRKSISIDSCRGDDRIICCPRVKGSMFDISSLIDSIKK